MMKVCSSEAKQTGEKIDRIRAEARTVVSKDTNEGRPTAGEDDTGKRCDNTVVGCMIINEIESSVFL